MLEAIRKIVEETLEEIAFIVGSIYYFFAAVVPWGEVVGLAIVTLLVCLFMGAIL